MHSDVSICCELRTVNFTEHGIVLHHQQATLCKLDRGGHLTAGQNVLKVTYEQMVDSPLEVVQKVCGFLGVRPPEQAPCQPFTQQSCGELRTAFDAASWDELCNAFKHTERATDFELSRFAAASTREPEAVRDTLSDNICSTPS
jgi:hypothetical protein